MNADLKLRIPLGGDSDYSGAVWNYGVGVSHVLAADDLFTPTGRSIGVIGSLEFLATSFTGGRVTAPTTSSTITPLAADGFHAFRIQPGLRFQCSENAEFGVTAGLPISHDRLFDSSLGLQFRWLY